MNERDILTSEELGFVWKRDYKTFNHLVEITAKREGFGDILAYGWKRLAKEDEYPQRLYY
jgi:aldehyde:ferredoxin oxidoreductase